MSVYGRFTNGTKDIHFVDCEFLNKLPEFPGNLDFNFNQNWTDFDDKIIFSECIFKNNKGDKWNGDKIKLENCTIDSSDFIGI